MSPGTAAATVRSGAQARPDPFQLLVAEHNLLRLQLRRARDTIVSGGASRAIGQLANAVRRHMNREATALYPVCERLFGGPNGAVAVMRADHEAMDADLRNLERAAAGDASWTASRLDSFTDRIGRHFSREERVLFPLMSALLSGSEISRLAERIRSPKT